MTTLRSFCPPPDPTSGRNLNKYTHQGWTRHLQFAHVRGKKAVNPAIDRSMSAWTRRAEATAYRGAKAKALTKILIGLVPKISLNDKYIKKYLSILFEGFVQRDNYFMPLCRIAFYTASGFSFYFFWRLKKSKSLAGSRLRNRKVFSKLLYKLIFRGKW